MTPHSKRSVFRSLTRWLLAGGAVLVTLAALIVQLENFRGARAWLKYRSQWEAKGEHFDLTAILPKPAPPEQNFAMTPFLAPLLDYRYDADLRTIRWADSNGYQRAMHSFNLSEGAGKIKHPRLGTWQKGELTDLEGWRDFFARNTNFASRLKGGKAAEDVKRALEVHAPILDELREASRRPHAVFPIHYEESFLALVPHLGVLRNAANVLSLRAAARLALGESDPALDDIKLSLDLADSLRPEVLLISQLVRISIIQISLQAVWEGLETGAWRPEQLAELQDRLSRTHVIDALPVAFRGERALGIDYLERLRKGDRPIEFAASQENEHHWRSARWIPKGLYYQNYITLCRAYQTMISRIDPSNHTVDFRGGIDLSGEIFARPWPYRIIVQNLAAATDKAVTKAAHAEADLKMASLAVALERYRSRTKHYPESLERLVPVFMNAIPSDPVNGGSFHYSLREDGDYLLYSIGSNQIDDRGTSSAPKLEEGDWVWPRRRAGENQRRNRGPDPI